jgi:hypothetical protein
MHITLSPTRRDGRPTFERQGDTLLINGEAFDFSGIPEGATLPAEAVASDWIAGPVSREGGVLHFTLLLSHGANAPEAARFPQPVTVTSDGPITLPAYEIEEGSAE